MAPRRGQIYKIIPLRTRFGRLIYLGRINKIKKEGKNSYPLARFLCDCGETIIRVQYRVTAPSATIKSCGCLQRDWARKHLLTLTYKHGHANTRLHDVWSLMKSRCSNSKYKNYKNYGGRGITVCKRWESYENFYADMGPDRPGMTIERIDNSKGYSPENCRWATRKEQANNKTTNRFLTYKGETKTVAQWADYLNIPYQRIANRLRKNWTIERVLEEKPWKRTMSRITN